MVVTHDGGECITGTCTPRDAQDRADRRMARLLRRLVAVGPADGRGVLRTTDSYVTAFTAQAFEGRTSPLLAGARSTPGVTLLAHP